MTLTAKQLDILSHMCADVAKGLFLASLAAPAITSALSFLISIRIFTLALAFTVVALGIAEKRGVNL